MMRRAFTLLELSLAMLMAALLVVAATGLFMSLERGDRRFEKRYAQVNDLDRLQTVLRRTFATLAVTDETAPAGTPGIRTPGSNTTTPQPGRSPDVNAGSSSTSSSTNSNSKSGNPGGAASNSSTDSGSSTTGSSNTGSGSSTPRANTVPAPRMRIVEDPDPAIRSMVNRSKALYGGGGSDILSPQLLEVVTAGQPVPDDNPQSLESGGVTLAAASRGILLNRGAIYLRPSPNDTADTPPEERSWEILYTRLAPRERLDEFGAALPPLAPIGNPIVLASGIRYFNVKVFRERNWTRVMEATYFQHLPAYVQVEVETTTGLWAKWLFEVGWLLGPETQAEREARGGGGAGGAGGGSGGGGDKKDGKDGGGLTTTTGITKSATTGKGGTTATEKGTVLQVPTDVRAEPDRKK